MPQRSSRQRSAAVRSTRLTCMPRSKWLMAEHLCKVLRVTEEADTDLIVVGSHRPAMKDYLLGTNDAGHAPRPCSVLVVRERAWMALAGRSCLRPFGTRSRPML